MSTQDNDTSGPELAYDPHRFSAEAKGKPRKMLLPIFIAFIVVMGVIGGSVIFAKSQLNAYMATREAKSKLEKSKQQEDKNRKEKEFTSTAALPASFNTPKTPAVPELLTDLPVIPLPTGKPIQPTSPPKMMLGDGVSDASAEKNTAKSIAQPPATQTALLGQPLPATAPRPAPTRVRTVQEFANQSAEKAPVTSTPQASAANLGDRSLVLARGAFIPCVLETQLISALAGSSSCIVPQNVYSDDGKVLLVDKGSRMIGSYQNTVIPGSSRIAIIWHRIKTPTGVVLDVESPVADGVGSMGAIGVVDNHWIERIGAAFLLSIIEDAITIATANKTEQQNIVTPPPQIIIIGAPPTATSASNTTTPSATTGSIKSLSQEVLKSTINTPSTLYKNRGDRITVFVNRDLWFDSVYSLTKR